MDILKYFETNPEFVEYGYYELEVNRFLEGLSPTGYYYGSNQGDEASIGFWKNVEEEI